MWPSSLVWLAASSSKTTVTIYQSTRHNNLENLHFTSSLSLSWVQTLHPGILRLCLPKEPNTLPHCQKTAKRRAASRMLPNTQIIHSRLPVYVYVPNLIHSTPIFTFYCIHYCNNKQHNRRQELLQLNIQNEIFACRVSAGPCSTTHFSVTNCIERRKSAPSRWQDSIYKVYDCWAGKKLLTRSDSIYCEGFCCLGCDTMYSGR